MNAALTILWLFVFVLLAVGAFWLIARTIDPAIRLRDRFGALVDRALGWWFK